MKYIIASDIHGSFTYAEKLISIYNEEKADKLVLLGDILYHGPRNDLPDGYAPKKVFALLNEYKNDIICVRGNCDAEVDQMVLEFPIMADYVVLENGNHAIFATHGHVYNENSMPKLNKGDILLHGHTHLVVCKNLDDVTYINPGSISLPKDGNHGYIVFEDGVFTFKTIDGKILNQFNSL